MLFNEITMLNYSRPMRERLKTRKVCGPYKWRPSEPNKGRGFYQASKHLACDARGSTFDLRLELANEHLRGYRLCDINGYYADTFQDTTLTPIVARLPHGRGFLAGWTMGTGMCASLDCSIYSDAESAARAAHSMAEYDAEKERDACETNNDEGDE
jgi:hypothetical protein